MHFTSSQPSGHPSQFFQHGPESGQNTSGQATHGLARARGQGAGRGTGRVVGWGRSMWSRTLAVISDALVLGPLRGSPAVATTPSMKQPKHGYAERLSCPEEEESSHSWTPTYQATASSDSGMFASPKEVPSAAHGGSSMSYQRHVFGWGTSTKQYSSTGSVPPEQAGMHKSLEAERIEPRFSASSSSESLSVGRGNYFLSRCR